MLALLAGYALLALLASVRGHRAAKKGGATLLCVLVATLINLGAIYMLRAAGAGTELSAAWLVIQPIVALWLPLHYFGERTVE